MNTQTAPMYPLILMRRKLICFTQEQSGYASLVTTSKKKEKKEKDFASNCITYLYTINDWLRASIASIIYSRHWHFQA